MTRLGFSVHLAFCLLYCILLNDLSLAVDIMSVFVVLPVSVVKVGSDGLLVCCGTQITMSEETLRQIEIRLTQAVALLQDRLDWLTSDSRRLCGVITDSCVCLVLDYQTTDDRQFSLFTDMVACILNEQVSQLSQFNILRSVTVRLTPDSNTSYTYRTQDSSRE